jgi:hypothetical protein
MLYNLRPWHLLLASWSAGSTSASSIEVPRIVEVWERAGYMDVEEASAWRERIAVWRRFGRCGRPQPVADPLLDDPDPFVPSNCAELPDSQRRQLQSNSFRVDTFVRIRGPVL